MQLDVLAQEDTFHHVALRGRLDADFNNALSTSKHAFVDLSEVTFLSSMGVRMLLSMAKTLDRGGSKVVLLAPSEFVAETLRHTAIDELIPVVVDLQAAAALVAGETR